MSKETILIPNVDVHLLDAQRLALAEHLATVRQEITPEMLEKLDGILNMLDVWSDSRRPDMPAKFSRWISKTAAKPYPHGVVSVVGLSDDKTRIQYAREGFCEIYSAVPETFYGSYRPVTTEELDTPINLELAYFDFDDGPSILAFTRGNRWNGWGCPLVEKESYRKWLDRGVIEKESDYSSMWFDGDDLILRDPQAIEDGEDANSVMKSHRIEYEGRSYEVYDVSNGWCWNQYDIDRLKAGAFTFGPNLGDTFVPEGLESWHAATVEDIQKAWRPERD